MAVTHIQSKAGNYVADHAGTGNAGCTVTLDSTALAGRTIVISVMVRATETQPTFPAGFDLVTGETHNGGWVTMRGMWVARKVLTAQEGSFTVYNASYNSEAVVVVSEFSNLGACVLDGTSGPILGAGATMSWTSPTGLDTGAERVLMTLGSWSTLEVGSMVPASFTEIADESYAATSQRLEIGFRYIASTSPPYDETASATNIKWGLYIGLTVEAVAVTPPDPEPGVWFDWDRDGFDDGTLTSISADALLARMLPQGGTASASNDNVTSYVRRFTWNRGSSYDYSGSEQPGGATIILKPSILSTSLYAKFSPGLPVWIGANSTDGSLTAGTAVKGVFAGYTREFVPIVEDGAVTGVEVICDDALASYRDRPIELSAATGRSQADVRTAILTAIDEDTDRISLASEPTELPISAVSSSDALGVLSELNRASGTRHWVAPSDSKEDWYHYTTVNRNHKLTSAVDGSIDGDDIDAISGYRITWDTVNNYQKASVTPISFSPDTLIVWEHDSLPLALDFRASRIIWAEFDDYVLDATVESAGTVSGGGSVTATLTNFGKTAKIVLSAPRRATVTSLQVRGRQVQRADSQAVIAEDLASQNTYRMRAGQDITSDLVGQPADAQGVVDFLVWKFANPLKRPAVSIAEKNAASRSLIFDRDLYDLLSVTIDRLSVSGRRFEIIGIRGECVPPTQWAVTFELQETANQSALTLFTVGVSAVGGSHPIWI